VGGITWDLALTGGNGGKCGGKPSGFGVTIGGVALHRYRTVLALPGVRALVVLMFFARIPATATGMVLTLHVVLTLHHGYGAAGLVGAAGTVGIAVGAPLMGRLVDSWGLRPMVLLTSLGEGAFWLSAWLLPYQPLLLVAFAGGLVSLPTMSIGRQALAALVPAEHRRTAYSLDSMSVELSFMVGPALGVLIATRASTPIAMIVVGALLLGSGAALYLINPPTRSDAERAVAGARPPRRSWLGGSMAGVLVTLLGAIFVLAGIEVAEVAALRSVGQVSWTGPVTIVMCLASLVGGLVYGALRRSFAPAALVAVMGLLCLPVGLAGGQWWLLALALIPTNLLCAPSLTAANEQLSVLAPVAARGEAMGLGSSASTLGAAIGSPVIGLVVDHTGATGGFLVAGLGGLVVAGLVLVLARRRPGKPTAPLPTPATPAPAA
jgi:MFS family permease